MKKKNTFWPPAQGPDHTAVKGQNQTSSCRLYEQQYLHCRLHEQQGTRGKTTEPRSGTAASEKMSNTTSTIFKQPITAAADCSITM